MHNPKISPISSQIAEKIKSDDATGIVSGCPWNSPIPNQLPVPMANKDWATSDKIRNELTAMGFEIKDTKDGAEWKLSK